MNPVFVVGFYRSGTSLLYALLNQHPQIALMFESNLWDFPEAFSGLRFKRDWLQRQEFYNQALSRHRLIFGGSLHGLENTRTPEDLYRTFRDVKNGMLWGEKSPAYSVRLRQLMRRYPNCSFILLWRNPVEIHRSVIRAGPRDPFLQRPGMLSRLIYYQEKLIQQAVELERRGARICHVTYDSLTGDSEKTCRKICDFLGIEFDEKMLDLASADLSAIGPGPEHNHLRNGKITRQQFAEEIIEPSALRKLERFNARWMRLQSHWLDTPINSLGVQEPSGLERFYQRLAGSFFCALDACKRLLFEFLPLAWLRTYRQTKIWFAVRGPVARPTLRNQLSVHGVTIFLSYLILATVVMIDRLTGPDMTMAPFYMIPPTILTLIVGRRWGTFAAAVAVICWSAIQDIQLKGSMELGIVAWNSIMRFFVFLTIVLLLDKVRVEAASSRKTNI